MASDEELVDLQRTLYTSKNPTRRWLHCSRRDWIVSALRRYAGTTKSTASHALEVGPGAGIYLPELANLHANVTGSDIEKAYLRHSSPLRNSLGNLSLAVDDITRSSLPEASFDMILCTEVIEHIPDSQAALCEMHRLLKPGSILVISTPQKYSPLELVAKVAFLPVIIQLVRLIYREPILETGHINLMTEGQVRDQLKVAGFNVLESHKSGLYLPILAEIGGGHGLKIEQYIENKIYRTMFDWLLWTQYYVAVA